MEDAHLTVSPLSDKKNSLFAIFDGHGGICGSSKVLKFQLLLRNISLQSSKAINLIKIRTMREL